MSAEAKPIPRRRKSDLEVIEETVRKDAQVEPEQYGHDSEVPEGGE